MRLLLKLKSLERSAYEMQYHYHLQGFIYNLLKDTRYHYIHNTGNYKFFCFSNIFPVTKDLQMNDLRTLIISSPDRDFIECLSQRLYGLNHRELKIGRMKFRVDSIEKFMLKVPKELPFTLITGTPIIIRVPRVNYKMYNIEPKRNYDYIYWRKGYPTDLFIFQLENNLLKKFMEYLREVNQSTVKGREDIAMPIQSSFSLLHRFRFKKQISTRIYMKGFEQIVIGTIWEFGFNVGADRDIIQFALDAGLGERNPLGFGFMNLINK